MKEGLLDVTEVPATLKVIGVTDRVVVAPVAVVVQDTGILGTTVNLQILTVIHPLLSDMLGRGVVTKNRRKSPHLPKIAAYTGDKNWHSFIYQFERMARKYEWSTRKKGERLIDCLGGKAINYVRELRIGNDFRLLKEKLSRRFGAKDAPITVRRGLQPGRE